MISLGTELKINVNIQPIDGFHMKDIDFVCVFYTYANRKVEISKAEMKQVDDDNYLAIIDTEKAMKLGKGRILVEITAHIEDADFPDGLRTEKTTVWTGVTVD